MTPSASVIVPVPVVVFPLWSVLVTATVVTGEVSVAPPKFSCHCPADGDVSWEFVPSVNVWPFAATVNTDVLTESKVPVISGAASVVTVWEFTVGVPRVGFVVLKVAFRVVGLTLKKTEPGSWLIVVSL